MELISDCLGSLQQSEQIPEILQTILSEFQWKHFDRLEKLLPKEKLLEILNIEQNLEVLVNAEEYFRKKVLEPAGSNVSWNTRDQHMALTVGRIQERLHHLTTISEEKQASVTTTTTTTRVVVWAHNSHIGNAAATSRGGSDFTRNENWNLGQMVRQVSDRCYALGFDTYSGTVTSLESRGGDATKKCELLPAIDGSSGHWCHQICQALACDAFMLPLDTSAGEMDAKILETFSTIIDQRYVGVHYHPETELRSHYIKGSLIGQYDALVFINTTNALQVLTTAELQNATGHKTPWNMPASSNKYGLRRLMQEYVQLQNHPLPNICVSSEEANIYRCHFLLKFDTGIFAGGEYHGLLDLPNEYPMAPPKISFFTPSGRFETGKRVCVSFSDYHPGEKISCMRAALHVAAIEFEI